jgi:AmmeMemoRadiSam system protein A
LARLSLETYVRERRRITPDEKPGLPAELLSIRAGAFVSLKKDGELRGCIGTIAPTQDNLAEEICANAISAGRHDPRFPPVTAGEMDELVYDVDVLGAPEAVKSADQLDPERYGVIVSCADGRRGLLLPDLDGVDTVAEQLRIAAAKGHIDLKRDDCLLERFEVVRHT